MFVDEGEFCTFNVMGSISLLACCGGAWLGVTSSARGLACQQLSFQMLIELLMSHSFIPKYKKDCPISRSSKTALALPGLVWSL